MGYYCLNHMSSKRTRLCPIQKLKPSICPLAVEGSGGSLLKMSKKINILTF